MKSVTISLPIALTVAVGTLLVLRVDPIDSQQATDSVIETVLEDVPRGTDDGITKQVEPLRTSSTATIDDTSAISPPAVADELLDRVTGENVVRADQPDRDGVDSDDAFADLPARERVILVVVEATALGSDFFGLERVTRLFEDEPELLESAADIVLSGDLSKEEQSALIGALAECHDSRAEALLVELAGNSDLGGLVREAAAAGLAKMRSPQPRSSDREFRSVEELSDEA